jgi:hypothetical protein
VVLGPDQIPRVDAAQAARRPALAVLSAAIHGNGPSGVDIVLAALDALGKMKHDDGVYYFDWILAELNTTTRRRLEEIMYARKYEYQSDFARTYFSQGEAKGLAAGEAKGLAAGEAKGLAAGEAKGLAAGKAEGLAAGKAEGLAAGEAKAILAVLDARGLRVPTSVRQRIMTCSDLAQLDRWLARAVRVPKATALFEPDDSRHR